MSDLQHLFHQEYPEFFGIIVKHELAITNRETKKYDVKLKQHIIIPN